MCVVHGAGDLRLAVDAPCVGGANRLSDRSEKILKKILKSRRTPAQKRRSRLTGDRPPDPSGCRPRGPRDPVGGIHRGAGTV
jgi:hypothetical protein